MRRYFDYAIIFDFALAMTTAIAIIYSKSTLKLFLTLPTENNINNLCTSLISVCATLIGFLLTIITVIITFKNGFKDRTTIEEKPKEESKNQIPEITVFERKISKETKFYKSDIHKRVVNVFVHASYEIGITLLILLIIQSNALNLKTHYILIINFCSLIIILLSMIRSLYIFQLFLNVHLPHDKKDKTA